MNEATKRVYDFIFKEQLKDSLILTEESINKMGPQKTLFGNYLKEGQQLVRILVSEENENNGINLTLSVFMYPKELDLMESLYCYKYSNGSNGYFSVFEKTSLVNVEPTK